MLLTWYTQVDDLQIFASVAAWICASECRISSMH